MAGGFSFSFEVDDEAPSQHSHPESLNSDFAAAPSAPTIESLEAPRMLDIKELLSTLPSKISYSILSLTTPTDGSHTTTRLPRRELFDVRLQLIAEDTPDADALLAHIQSSDISTSIYEGGFKTWECALDLARLLLHHQPNQKTAVNDEPDHVVELGCGTAIPSLALFQSALQRDHGNSKSLHFTLADYNAEVLRLVTLPNLLLIWVASISRANTKFPSGGSDFTTTNPLHTHSDGDLDITPALLDAFVADLAARNLHLTLVSGSWAPAPPFCALVPVVGSQKTLVLGSETIYSPASLTAFSEAMVAILSRAEAGRAIVAAKRVYFGVGGGVDAFREDVSRRGAVVADIDGSDIGLGADGVRRCFLDVRIERRMAT